MRLIRKLAYRLGLPLRVPDTWGEGPALAAQVGRAPVTVASERTPLVLSTEALASAFLLPAAAANRGLRGAGIDSDWLVGSQRILATARSWWGWNPARPDFSPREPRVPRAPGVALAFSLGVDSFYSCFFARPAPTLLVLAAGFDIPPEETAILRRMQESVSIVAQAIGTDWTMVSTNLRSHPLYRRISWDRTHGGALAFLGHVLERHAGTMLISSSYHQDLLGPWGSHPDLDPYWSSGSVRFSHIGTDVQRSAKLRRLVHDPVAGPLVRAHLRVCWEAPSASGNCGRCHKCVMTRINLHRDAPGFRLENMAEDVPLHEAIDALPPILNELSLNFRRELTGCPDPRVERALRDLIRRSEAAAPARCATTSTAS